jgi:hypothetical protein
MDFFVKKKDFPCCEKNSSLTTTKPLEVL